MPARAPLLPIVIFFFLFFVLPSSLNAAGFSVELIHHDSPKSPFYNASDGPFDRVWRAIDRSNSRINYFISSTSAASRKDASSTVVPRAASYLMSISLGTPPLEIVAIADTGSDLIWTQCLPCKTCYKQVAPIFDPSKSSTYTDVSCNSNTCTELPKLGCTSNGGCMYGYSYGDGSYTNGVVGEETLTMTSSNGGGVNFPNITFGCGHENVGGFDSHGAGIIGLGGGPLSLVSQLGPSVGKKFAYCLVPYAQNTTSSRMDLGDNAVVSGNGTVITPLISKKGGETFFYVTLEKISVGENSISVPSPEKGNIFIDSGTTLTILPTSAHKSLLPVLKSAINLQPVPDPSKYFDLCYEFGKDLKIPDLTFGFDGGELVLGSMNTFLQVNENLTCLSFLGSDSVAIIGNIAQQNFKIGYDLSDMKVAFQPTDCTHQ
ncbi:hypothetical protein MRB53_003659 [Persea americana]|uniref:Uncharacterized protein n=1 Tax=Persea americana TaxID=3435 RepID=A0ACC2MY07_PERAE|nr:hypothetical protein MRB53_003659 [Persea americana]